jgi:protein-glutamine gamma-glutamyltransferase
MIKISGSSVQPHGIYNQWLLSPMEKMIVEKMAMSQTVYNYDSLRVLAFELKLRMEIVSSARDLNQSGAIFATFEESRCNTDYWELNEIGVFKLKAGVKPSTGIRDIFFSGFKYAFECATAMVVVYYKAVLESLHEQTFNELFANISLYSWNHDPDLGINSYIAKDYFPGDVRYFKNPDVNPETSEWQGLNVVVMGDGSYYGHGAGITTADHIIFILNQQRKPGATQSAYLLDQVTRPNFKRIAQIAAETNRTYQNNQMPKEVLLFSKKHFKESTSFEDYLSVVSTLEKQCIKICIGNITYKWL